MMMNVVHVGEEGSVSHNILLIYMFIVERNMCYSHHHFVHVLPVYLCDSCNQVECKKCVKLDMEELQDKDPDALFYCETCMSKGGCSEKKDGGAKKDEGGKKEGGGEQSGVGKEKKSALERKVDQMMPLLNQWRAEAMGNVMVDDSKEQLSKDDVSFIAKTRKWNVHVAHKAFKELIEMMEAKKEGDATFTGPVVVKYYERMMNEMGYSGWDLPTDLSLRLKRFVG